MEQASNQSQLLGNYSCEQCNIELPTMSDYRNHLLDVHPNSKEAKELNTEQESFECEFCHKKFRTKTFMTIHMELSHDINKEEKYKCNICEKSFNFSFTLKSHYKRNHDMKMFYDIQNKIYKCKLCEKSFNLKLSLKGHYSRTHKFTDEKL